MGDEKHTLGGVKAFSGSTIPSLYSPDIMLLLVTSLLSIMFSGLYHSSSFLPNAFYPNKDKMHWKIQKLCGVLGGERFVLFRYSHISEHRHKNTSPGIYHFFV